MTSAKAKTDKPTDFWGMTRAFHGMWWAVIAASFVLGILLCIFPIVFPEWMTRPIRVVPRYQFRLFVAVFLIAISLGHVISHFFSYLLSWLFKLEPWASRENLYPPAIIGVFETVMYIIFFIGERPEFIGPWLALKVAGQWKLWQEPETAEGRRRFYKFLLGNLICIAVTAVAYLTILSFVMLS